MAQKPIAMEQLKQVVQLQNDGVSIREIARRTGISRNSVRKYLSRLNTSKNITDKEMADKAYSNDVLELDAERLRQVTMHFSTAGDELSKTGVTRQLLWQEYLAQHPDGYSYSRYCYHLNQYLKNRDLSMHLEYQAGDMIMIDFAGKKQHYIDVATAERITCEVFVAILPFSGLIFCQATPSQKTADFTDCINSMLKFYGGIPATIVCDNLKTAVKRVDRYEPQFTDICHQLSEHYDTTFSATRPYSPRDKAMVERAVNIIYTHVYAPLRNRDFTGLQSLNAAMQEQLILLNNKPYKNTPYSRRYFFEQQEQSSLKVLPSECFSQCTRNPGFLNNMVHRNNTNQNIIQHLIHVLTARFGYARTAKLPSGQKDEVIATQQSRHEVMSLVSSELLIRNLVYFFYLPGTHYCDELLCKVVYIVQIAGASGFFFIFQ